MKKLFTLLLLMVGLGMNAQTFDFSCGISVEEFSQCLMNNRGTRVVVNNLLFGAGGNTADRWTIEYQSSNLFGIYDNGVRLGQRASLQSLLDFYSFFVDLNGVECPEPELPSIDPTELSDCMKASIGTEVPVNNLDSNNTYIIVYQTDFRLYRNSVNLSNLVTSDDSLEDLVMYGNTQGLFNLQGVVCPDPVAAKFSLNITTGGDGMGMITANPQPTNGMYDEDTVVTLTATADEGSSFREWAISEPADHIFHAGGNRPMTPSITVTITQDMSIGAEFDTATTETCTEGDVVNYLFGQLRFSMDAPSEYDQIDIILEAPSGTTTTVVFAPTISAFPYPVPSGVTTATTRITLTGFGGCIEDIEPINN